MIDGREEGRAALPAAEAGTLLALYDATYDAEHGTPQREAAWRRLSGYLGLLADAGWPARAAADVLGVSRQAIKQIRQNHEPAPAGLPAVPPAPPRADPKPPPGPSGAQPSPPLGEAMLAKLRQLLAESPGMQGQVRGTAREADPRWQAGRRFAALLHELTDGGGGPHSVHGIAGQLGLTYGALRNRLARHGYRPFPPSQAPPDLRDTQERPRPAPAQPSAAPPTGPPLVDAAPARGHLRILEAQVGRQARRAMSGLTGLSPTTIANVIGDHVRHRQIPAGADAALRALTVDRLRAWSDENPQPRDDLPAAPTMALVDDLLAWGWSKARISREIGGGTHLQVGMGAGGRWVRRETADAVRALHDRLGGRPGP